MEIEELSLQKKQRILIGIVIASAVLSLVLPFFGFYASMCGVCLAMVALVGAIIAMFVQARVFGGVMSALVFCIIGPLSTVFTFHSFLKHSYGVDYYTISDLFEKLEKYGADAHNARVSGNHELALACNTKMVDEIKLFVTSIVDYQINKAKEDGDTELVKELEEGRQKFIDEFNAEFQEKFRTRFKIDSPPVKHELTPFQEYEE